MTARPTWLGSRNAYAYTRANEPKHKSTVKDGGLLVDLKDTKALSWKQIAASFPDRSSSTLQVRYRTKPEKKQMTRSGGTLCGVAIAIASAAESEEAEVMC